MFPKLSALRTGTIPYCLRSLASRVGALLLFLVAALPAAADLDTWTRRVSNTTQDLRTVFFGNNIFVAAGVGSIVTSIDGGVTWVKRADILSQANGGTYGAPVGRYVIGALTGVYTSTDAITWTLSPTAMPAPIRGVAYGAGVYVAVGDQGVIQTSPDGITWTFAPSGISSTLHNVTFAENQFVAVGDLGRILTSPNGTTWTQRTSNVSSTLLSVANEEAYFAVGAAGSIVVSGDAVAWFPLPSGTVSHLFGVTVANQTAVVVGRGQGAAGTETAKILTRLLTGTKWTERPSGFMGELYGVTYANGTLVAVGWGGAIVTSTGGPSNNANLASLAPSSGTLTPVFASATTSYSASVASGVASITVTPTVTGSAATVKVNGTAVTSGSASGAIPLAVGANTINVVVTAEDTIATKTYTLAVTRAIDNSPRLGNISTRMQVLTGNDVLIGGFVIGGSTNKRVAIVATGPSLVPFGITNALSNPTLRLVRSSDQAVLATSDDWQTAANQADLTAAGLAPSNALEAAILVDLAPGAYTAIVEGAGGVTGVSVIGVYEVNHPEAPLVNISTRGRVLTGNDVMIGGFVISGTGPQTLAIVATGPSLAPFGIANPLPNPTISLVRSSDQVVVATNDDWQTDANSAQLQAAGFAPSNPLESGLYVTLPPGAYTVIVQGVGGGTGVAVIGVYKVN